MSHGSERPTMYFGTLATLTGIIEELAHVPAPGDEKPEIGDTDRCGPPDVGYEEETGVIEHELLERLRDATRLGDGEQ